MNMYSCRTGLLPWFLDNHFMVTIEWISEGPNRKSCHVAGIHRLWTTVRRCPQPRPLRGPYRPSQQMSSMTTRTRTIASYGGLPCIIFSRFKCFVTWSAFLFVPDIIHCPWWPDCYQYIQLYIVATPPSIIIIMIKWFTFNSKPTHFWA